MRANRLLSLISILVFLASLSSLMVFQQCANIVPPTGGPRDSIPPVIVESNPENYSTNISSPVIELTFDKFVQLRNIDRQLIISPPQKERPQFTLRGRTVRIDLNTELIPNTTYLLNFGEGIVDLNEGNVLEDNEFVFSTGDEIDSLYYTGIVLDAFESKPVENVLVMMYDNLNDSVPYTSMPLYAARTDSEGRFRINNLRADTFRVFALKGEGNNYLYERPGEEAIGFRDEFISPVQVPSDEKDTIDSIRNGYSINYPPGDTLYLFREATGMQRLELFRRDIRGKLFFRFNKPLKKDWDITPLNFSPGDNWKITEISQDMDSVIYWLTDQDVMSNDSLQFEAVYWATGPSDSLHRKRDTITFLTPRSEKEDHLEVRTSVRNNGVLELNKNFAFIFDTPVASVDEEKVNLFHVQDTIVPVEYEFLQDSIFLRKCDFISEWDPGENYKLEVLPGAFTDIFGNQNDTLQIGFEIRSEDYYGTIILNVEDVTEQVIIQLTDDNYNVLREEILAEESELVFDYLAPQNYRIKAIFDRNRNNVWDTGNYLEGIQPEIGIFYPEPINVRSNWFTEETWNLYY